MQLAEHGLRELHGLPWHALRRAQLRLWLQCRVARHFRCMHAGLGAILLQTEAPSSLAQMSGLERKWRESAVKQSLHSMLCQCALRLEATSQRMPTCTPGWPDSMMGAKMPG